MAKFWGQVFDQLEINQPSWFQTSSYWGPDMKFHHRYEGSSETNLANAGGHLFMGSGFNSESFNDILNHEATHLIIRQNNAPEQDQQEFNQYSETMTEFLAQIISSNTISYPEQAGDMSYQEGVEELTLILQEIDTAADQELFGLKLLLKGVVDWNAGSTKRPIDYVYNYYSQHLPQQQDLFERLKLYTDQYFRYGVLEETDVLENHRQIIDLDEEEDAANGVGSSVSITPHTYKTAQSQTADKSPVASKPLSVRFAASPQFRLKLYLALS